MVTTYYKISLKWSHGYDPLRTFQFIFVCTACCYTWHRTMISIFGNIGDKSPRNNLMKPCQFYLLVLSLTLAFFLVWYNKKTKQKKRHYSYLEAAGDRNCVLEQLTLLTDSEYISEFYIFDTYKRVIDRGWGRSIIVSRKKLRVKQGRSFGQSQSS